MTPSLRRWRGGGVSWNRVPEESQPFPRKRESISLRSL
jgi:hypothetical protein